MLLLFGSPLSRGPKTSPFEAAGDDLYCDEDGSDGAAVVRGGVGGGGKVENGLEERGGGADCEREMELDKEDDESGLLFLFLSNEFLFNSRSMDVDRPVELASRNKLNDKRQ